MAEMVAASRTSCVSVRCARNTGRFVTSSVNATIARWRGEVCNVIIIRSIVYVAMARNAAII